MAIARQAAETLLTIRTRGRREAADESPNTAAQKFSNTAWNQAINDALVYLQTKQSGVQAGNALVPTTLTYLASSDTLDLGSLAVPDALTLESITHVEDLDDAKNPIPMEYVVPTVIETFRYRSSFYATTRRYYTLIASATTRQIAIRPVPDSNKSIRIWSIATPFLPGLDGDAFPLSPRWAELVALRATRALQSIEGEFTPAQEKRYGELLADYISFGEAQKRGPRYLPKRRQGRS